MAKVDLREPDLILFLQRQPPGLKQQFWKRSQYTADFPLSSGFSNNLCSLFSCNSSWRKGNRLVGFVHCCKEPMELAGVLVNDGNEHWFVVRYSILATKMSVTTLEVMVWKMSLKWNSSKGSEVKNNEKLFHGFCPNHGRFQLRTSKETRRFCLPSIRNFSGGGETDIYPATSTILQISWLRTPIDSPARWKTWQQEVANCGCMVNNLPDFLLTLAQSAQIPMDRTPPEIEFFDITTFEEQPGSPHAGADNEGETVQQDGGDSDGKVYNISTMKSSAYLIFSEICWGITRNNTRCRKRV